MNRHPHRNRHRDRGQVALEYIGFIPILLFVALCGIQLGWVAYVEQQADTAARTAARVEARRGEGGAAAGKAAIRPGLASLAQIDVDPGPDAVTATARITVRSIVPGLDSYTAERTAVMPNDDPKG
ncbi:pilus assembly protein [Streptomyces flavotricini]|uniref:Pilus assembly protein n=1 Tax=Streptomyces flavotricini TaxID=66888 RepID=A0ABS8E7L5_9ACTN|nr:TadE/TadG family type IV pilus assembly protein [Streptomyces flavotricini]MCC0096284.1 pilus assembly protein [Streptomyces flavotricini]